MPKWMGSAAWNRREARAGDRLPYAAHVDDVTLRLRDGGLMRTLQITGIPFEAQDSGQIDYMLGVREAMLRSVLDARFMLYHHVIRRPVEIAPGAQATGAFAAELGRRCHARLSQRRLFVNAQFLTILRRPSRDRRGWAGRLRRRGEAESAIDPVALAELEAATIALLTGLEPYGVRLLGTYATRGGRCSEPLELLSTLYNGATQPVLLPNAVTDLGHHIPYARVSFGLDRIETRATGTRDFVGMLSVKVYPDTTRAGLIDGLLRLPHPLVLTESFAPADGRIAGDRIDLALRRLKPDRKDGGGERGRMQAARTALGAGQAGFGHHHLSLAIREEMLTMLEQGLAQAASALAEIGAVAVREDVNLEPLFWGQFPGNEAYLVRRALISTANAAGFLSFHTVPSGSEAGNPWGDAVALFETAAATPYSFNFHDGDRGHFTIIGSGRTVVTNFLAAAAQKFAPRTILFDQDRNAELMIRAIGGRYDRIVPGTPAGLNPCALPDSPANRAFLRDWLGALLDARGSDEIATIARAIDACFGFDPAFRRLCFFRELLAGSRRPGPGDLAARLAPWIGQGEHAWAFDNARDERDYDALTLGLDMTALLDTPALRTPMMMYLCHRIEQQLDGTPTIILIDEGWTMLDDPIFATRIDGWLTALRARNAIVGFAARSPSIACGSHVSAGIVEQAATMIFMPDAKADAPDYCAGFGLSDHELDQIRALPAHSRNFLVRHAGHSVVARLDLAGENDLLTILSGREANVRRLDMVRGAVGDDPARWYPMVAGAAWPAARAGDPIWAKAAE